MVLKSPLSVYDVLGSKAGGAVLCKMAYEAAVRAKAYTGMQESHDPKFPEVKNYNLIFLLNFMAEFRSDLNNKSKVENKVWEAIPKRIKKYKKEFDIRKQLSLFN